MRCTAKRCISFRLTILATINLEHRTAQPGYQILEKEAATSPLMIILKQMFHIWSFFSIQLTH
jgi:hypothetical protein